MKTLGFITLALGYSLISTNSLARDGSVFGRGPAYRLEPVTWVGTFRCEEKKHAEDHRKDHDCGLEFVNDETGQVWNVRDHETLATLHRKHDGPVKARVSAMSSPRFLLGGSFIEVKTIEVLNRSAE